jgi:hypothetical protein
VHDDPAQAESDRSRQEVIETLDVRVLRIAASIVETNLAEALPTMRNFIAALPSQAPPLPQWERGPGGEGRRRQP